MRCSFHDYASPHSYVDQDPSAIGTQTVREMLLTSARLRLPEIVTNEQKKERIQSLAVEFGIDHILDRRFGEVGPCAHRLMSPTSRHARPPPPRPHRSRRAMC